MVFVTLALIAGAGWMLYLFGLTWIGAFAAASAVAGGIGAGMANWFAYLPWKTRRSFDRKPLAQISVALTLLQEGIAVRSERGFATYLWKDFIAWRADARATIAYLSPQLFLQFPARIGADGFPVAALNAALAREIGPMKR